MLFCTLFAVWAEELIITIMKKIFLSLSLLLASAAVAMADNPVKVEQLPEAAQTFLKAHFPDVKVAYANEDNELVKKEYEILLSDGVRVEFDADGNWKDVDCKFGRVPAAIVPAQISDYVSKHYPEIKIIKIERDRRGYEVSLSNGLEIDFDKQFSVVNIDD